MGAYEHSLAKLFQAPLDQFVAERKRLAAALRAAGDGAAATELANRRRPTASAWTVNQLYWQARETFDALLASAARVRKGDRAATTEYREMIATLRRRAASILEGAGHGAGDALLRRVTVTLAAIAAGGGFDPDLPGTISADRDPPGFEAVEARSTPPARVTPARDRGRLHLVDAEGRRKVARAAAAAEQERRKAEEAAERARQAEQARREAERQRLETKLRTARVEAVKCARALASLQRELGSAEKAAGHARDRVLDLERRLAELDDPG